MAAPTQGQNIASDAAGLAEAAWVRLAGSKVANVGGAQIALMESFVYARLVAKYHDVPHATLRATADDAVQSVVNQHSTGAQKPTVTGSIEAGVNSLPGVKQAESLNHFLGELTDPNTWLRSVYIVGGGIMILSGVFAIAKVLGAPNVPEPPIFTTAKLAKRAIKRGKTAKPSKGAKTK